MLQFAKANNQWLNSTVFAFFLTTKIVQVNWLFYLN